MDGCKYFCDLAYNSFPEPWCCKRCFLSDGELHDTSCDRERYKCNEFISPRHGSDESEDDYSDGSDESEDDAGDHCNASVSASAEDVKDEFVQLGN